MGIASSPLRDRVIFVEGAPRSGTTWLVTLLATHPDIAGVEAESHLFDYGVDRLFDNFEGRHPYLHGLRSYVGREQVVDLARDLCDGVLMAMREHVSAATDPGFVVEKTPIASKIAGLDLERKRECYPDAWYVHIVREREAVVRSLQRAPWMADRSSEACGALWDQNVGDARRVLGDVSRYREVAYEQLRADPVESCRALFEWLGVDSGAQVLETIRVLSRQQFSDLGAVSAGPAAGKGSHKPATLASAARGRLRRRREQLASRKGEAAAPATELAFRLVRAMREQDPETLRSLTGPRFELEFRSPGGDRALRGDEARDALVEIAEATFTRGYVGEWWGSAGGPADWWTKAAGKPFWSLFFTALGGDATRVDMAIGLVLEDDLIRRVVIISAGPLSGRPVVGAEAATLADESSTDG